MWHCPHHDYRCTACSTRNQKGLMEASDSLVKKGLGTGCPNGNSKCTKWPTLLFSNITGITSVSLLLQKMQYKSECNHRTACSPLLQDIDGSKVLRKDAVQTATEGGREPWRKKTFCSFSSHWPLRQRMSWVSLSLPWNKERKRRSTASRHQSSQVP